MSKNSKSIPSPEKLGTLATTTDGRRYVRFERRLNYPVQQVWDAITIAEQRDKWSPGFQLELKLGGKMEIWFGGECEGPAHVTGAVTEYDPPSILACGNMRYELTETDYGCLLVFTDILVFQETRTDGDIINSVLAGWHWYMDALEDNLAGKMVVQNTPEFDYSTVEIAGR